LAHKIVNNCDDKINSVIILLLKLGYIISINNIYYKNYYVAGRPNFDIGYPGKEDYPIHYG